MKSGFTLFELSIVLAILGLLAGGIVVGQAMYESAGTSQAISLHTQFQSAWNSFRATYNAIPGDMPNATKYWGTHTTLCPTLPGSASASGTCNGNGDGKINWYSNADGGTTVPSLPGSPAEARLVFQHLMLSEMLEIPLRSEMEMPFYVYPKFRRQYRSAWFVGSPWPGMADLYPSSTAWAGSEMRGNALQTAVNMGVDTQPLGAATTAAMVMAIDTKLDDGFPRRGKFQASNAVPYSASVAADPSQLLTCIADDGTGTYIYSTNSSTDSCRFLMSLDP